MSKLKECTWAGGTRSVLFECPGCGCPHVVHVANSASPKWEWNGDSDRPTFSPSILVTSPQWVPRGESIENQTQVTTICHSFVNDGKIQFLADSTHALAGQTVDLPEWEG